MVTRVSTYHPEYSRVRNGFLEVAKVKLKTKGMSYLLPCAGKQVIGEGPTKGGMESATFLLVKVVL